VLGADGGAAAAVAASFHAGEPMPGWVVGVDPDPPEPVERAPPSRRDCVDCPAADE